MSNEDDGNAKSRRRLRIPAALAVAFVGTSATVAMTFAGCSPSSPPEPVDAGESQAVTKDAGVGDDGSNSVIDAMVDAAPQMADAATPPPVDASMPPPDAPHT
jgi:hypothetical protein